jgi:hypothetical protein
MTSQRAAGPDKKLRISTFFYVTSRRARVGAREKKEKEKNESMSSLGCPSANFVIFQIPCRRMHCAVKSQARVAHALFCPWVGRNQKIKSEIALKVVIRGYIQAPGDPMIAQLLLSSCTISRRMAFFDSFLFALKFSPLPSSDTCKIGILRVCQQRDTASSFR